MGITSKDVELLDSVISTYQPKNVIELGAQNLYNQPVLPAPYAHEYYEAKGLNYKCVDLSKENDCIEIDLSKPIPKALNKLLASFDLVTDFGTSEHVGKDGKHDLKSYYNCWLNKYNLCKVGGVIISVNPKTGNWPGHGFNYVDENFYFKLAELLKLNLNEDFELKEHPAMGNVTDGWNMIFIFKKPDAPFPTFEQFKTLPVYEK